MKRTQRLFILMFVALLASAWAEPWPLKPGVGVGPITLGAEYIQVNRYLTPADALGNKAKAYLRYKEGVDVECENYKVVQILVNQSQFASKSGPVNVAMEGNLKIGSSVVQMETALGRNYDARELKVARSQPKEVYYAYASKGLGVLTRAGKIIQFAIWPRK